MTQPDQPNKKPSSEDNHGRKPTSLLRAFRCFRTYLVQFEPPSIYVAYKQLSSKNISAKKPFSQNVSQTRGIPSLSVIRSISSITYQHSSCVFFVCFITGRYVGSRPIKLRKSSWRQRSFDVVKRKEKEKVQLLQMFNKS